MDSTDEFRTKLYKKFGKRLIIPDDAEYIGSKKDIKVVCPKHGIRWMKPNNLLSGAKCRECGYEEVATKNRDSIDVFLAKAHKRHGDKYEYPLINEEYGRGKIHILCKKCGKMFEQRPSMHVFGNGCPNCNKFPKKYSNETLQNAIHERHPLVDLVSEYNGDNDSKIKVRCRKHGIEWNTTPHMLAQQKYGCKMCFHEHRTNEIREKQSEVFKKFVEEKYKPLYDTSRVEYVNSNTKVKLICPKHGEFYLKPKKMLNRMDGCPLCNESHLERKTRTILDNLEVEYEREKTFDWLKSKGNLFLDFYLPKYNIAIECQGEQHIIKRDGSIMNKKDKFEDKVKRDKLKRNLCNEHGIKVIYIMNESQSSNRINEEFGHMYDDALFIEDIEDNPQILLDKISETN